MYHKYRVKRDVNIVSFYYSMPVHHICPKCGRSYGVKEAFEIHLTRCGKSAEEPCPDPWCPHMFLTKERAEMHYREEHPFTPVRDQRQVENGKSQECQHHQPPTTEIDVAESPRRDEPPTFSELTEEKKLFKRVSHYKNAAGATVVVEEVWEYAT